MRLDDLDPSGNINDHGRGGGGGFGGFRGGSGGGGIAGLLIGLLPMLLGRKMGCGTMLIIGVIGFFLLQSGGLNLLGSGAGSPTPQQQSGNGQNVACDTELERFSCQVFTSTEQTWKKLFANGGAQYKPASLNFYQQGTKSGCGAAQSAMGPFYCPADNGIYLDTTFFAQMEQQMKAGGDFAYAYVIAHEMGHHIQNITGTAAKVRNLQQRSNKAQGNQLQVRMELQADCYAGVWAAQNRNRMEAGDLEEGMRAANAIGDDTLMRNSGRAIVKENFTHGTSQQRMEWLQRGLKSGNPNSCNAFQGVF